MKHSLVPFVCLTCSVWFLVGCTTPIEVEDGTGAEQSDPWVLYRLGREHYQAQEYEKALAPFTGAAEQGHANAQFHLGFMFFKGIGVPEDHTQAALWYRKAALQGDADAQRNLGTMYADGQGVRKDITEARVWLRKAADQGDAGARSALRILDANLQKFSEAFKVLRAIAAKGHPADQYNIGVMYDQGLGVETDDSEAVNWYRKAALQGHADAQNNLACMYRFGEGVPKDLAMTHAWVVVAAATGRGPLVEPEELEKRMTPRETVRSRQLAKELQQEIETARKTEEERFYKCHRAAEHGSAEAQYDLGVRYLRGHGVTKDVAKAHAWFIIAAAGGHDRASTARDRVVQMLAAEQVKRGEELAEEFRLRIGEKAGE